MITRCEVITLGKKVLFFTILFMLIGILYNATVLYHVQRDQESMLMRTLLETSSARLSVGLDMKILAASDSAYDLFEDQLLVGTDATRFIPPEYLERHKAAMNTFLNKEMQPGLIHALKCEILSATGQYRKVELTLILIKGLEGMYYGVKIVPLEQVNATVIQSL